MICRAPQVTVDLQFFEGASVETTFHKIEPHLRAGDGKSVELNTADNLQPCQLCGVGPFHVSSTRDAQNATGVALNTDKSSKDHDCRF